jgi:hypothetical protein
LLETFMERLPVGVVKPIARIQRKEIYLRALR